MSVDATFEETIDLEEPFYTGGGVQAPEETGLPCSIDGRGFILDLGPDRSLYDRYQRSPINLTNTQQSNSGGDQAQTSPEVWRRSVEDWSFGAGQRRIDRDQSLPGRFDDSRGVDVWTPWQMSLLHDTENRQAIGGAQAFLAICNDVLVCVTGTDLFWFAGGLGVDATQVTGVGSAVAVTSDGINLYVLDSTGNVELWQTAGAHHSYCNIPSVYVDTAFDGSRPLLAYVQGYLIAACGPDLIDITDASAPVRIYLARNPSWEWRAAVDGLNGTYLLGGAGTIWNLLGMTLKDDATTFNPPTISAPLPKGEVARSLGSYLGFLLIGTDSGWHFATTTDSSLKATYGRLVTSTTPVRCFEGQDRFVWYGVDGLGSGAAGLGRADLETFTSTLTPAYANDLASDSVGLGEVDAVITWQGKRVFAVRHVGVYAESDALVPNGWLTQGSAAFSSSDTKSGLYGEVFHSPLVGSVYVDASYDDDAFGQIGLSVSQDTVSTGHLKMDSRFKHVELRYRLIRSPGDTTKGPTLTRSEVRAIDVSGQAWEWRLPLRIETSEEYEDVPNERNVREQYDLLVDLTETRRLFTMRLYGRIYLNCYIADCLDLAESVTADGQDTQGTFIAVVRQVT